MSILFSYAYIFFFQAEDGIRDLVRSRGLGDVYKRQGLGHVDGLSEEIARAIVAERERGGPYQSLIDLAPVSYTHLTLPTSDLV